MFVGVILLAVLGFMSCAMTTKDQRRQARAKLARWNPAFIAIILVGFGLMLWPWQPEPQRPWPYSPCQVANVDGQCVR